MLNCTNNDKKTSNYNELRIATVPERSAQIWTVQSRKPTFAKTYIANSNGNGSLNGVEDSTYSAPVGCCDEY